MNRNTAIFIIVILVIFSGVYLRNTILGQANNNSQNASLSPTPANPLSESTLSLDIELNDVNTRISWLRIENSQNIFLYPNFSESLTSVRAKETNSCSSLISGGFYTTDNTPIGLFVSEGRQISSFAKNKLFNGIFSINYDELAQITPSLPVENLRVGLQTGPVLIKDGKKMDLADTSDEFARRAVVAISEDQEIIFMILYQKGSVFMGPRLSELPGVIEQISEKIGVNIDHAINLDGGSASAFHSEGIKLSEITTIGSYFCIK